jgi:hypothetical protein
MMGAWRRQGLAPRPEGPRARLADHEGVEPLRPRHTAGPVIDALAKFRPAFERRCRSLEVLPTFDLDEALAPAREATARDDAGAHFDEEARDRPLSPPPRS